MTKKGWNSHYSFGIVLIFYCVYLRGEKDREEPQAAQWARADQRATAKSRSHLPPFEAGFLSWPLPQLYPRRAAPWNRKILLSPFAIFFGGLLGIQMYGIASHFFRGFQGRNSGLLSGSLGGASNGAIFPSAPGPSLTGSFYSYSLNVSHLTSFTFTLTHDMKQTVRPTPSAQPLVPAVPEKAFIHSLGWDRQTYSL